MLMAKCLAQDGSGGEQLQDPEWRVNFVPLFVPFMRF
jgi:hypothetical protein